MLLCADIGNSRTTIGLLGESPDEDSAGGRVVEHWRVATDDRRTADEWGVLVRTLLRESDDTGELTGVAVCSAVPAVLHEWREMLGAFFGSVPHVVVEPGVKTGIPIMVDNPREVGADRIVNSLAAAELVGAPALVVDFGTATTFDVVNAKREYVGGAIAPGIEISLDALGRRGAQLRKVELLRPRCVIAKNTVEALQSGALHGFASLVDGMAAKMIEALGADPADVRVISTGDLADLVVEECRAFTDHRPFLTLEGLALVYARNG